MALTQGSAATWADIANLYNKFTYEAVGTSGTIYYLKLGNHTRTVANWNGTSDFSIPNVTAGSIIQPSDVNNLVNRINTMRSETHLTGFASVSVPTQGTLITSSYITNLQNTINGMLNTCHNNSGCFSFGDCDFKSFSFFESGCNGFGH